jgi:hypothetical protein
MEHSGPGEVDRVEVPRLVGMVVADARQAGHRAGLVVVSPDVDGPPLGAHLAWHLDRYRPAPGGRN